MRIIAATLFCITLAFTGCTSKQNISPNGVAYCLKNGEKWNATYVYGCQFDSTNQIFLIFKKTFCKYAQTNPDCGNRDEIFFEVPLQVNRYNILTSDHKKVPYAYYYIKNGGDITISKFEITSSPTDTVSYLTIDEIDPEQMRVKGRFSLYFKNRQNPDETVTFSDGTYIIYFEKCY